MRLTLRTLLAFLDDILDESDARELQKKIDESEMATQLVHRIRQIVGQTRLDSPALEAEGTGADANSVSEYLDNTLPADEVPEFERICLDSDVQLGEVAACHQILTIVLGEPAEITPRLKNHVYKLSSMPLTSGDQAQAETVSTRVDAASQDDDVGLLDDDDDVTPVSLIEPVAGATYDSDEHWTSAPDYLKKPKRGIWKPVGIAALIAFCLAFAGLRGMGPLNQSHPIATWLRGEQVTAVPTDDLPPEVPEVVIPAAPSEANDLPANAGENIDVIAAEETVTPAQEETLPPSTSGLKQAAVAPQGIETPEMRTPDDTANGFNAGDFSADPPFDSADNEPAISPPDTSITNEEPPVIQDSLTASDPSDEFPIDDIPLAGPNNGSLTPGPETTAASNPDLPSDEAAPLTPPEPKDLDIIDLGPGVDDVAVALPEPNRVADAVSDIQPDDVPEQAREVGRFLSEDQLLARYNAVSELWDRVPARDSISEEEELLSFPTFRPQLMLSTGMQFTLVGPARLRLLGLESDDSPIIHMEFGRAMIETFAQVGSKLRIDWSSYSATASLADMNSSFAIEVSRQLVPGANVEQDTAHTVLHVYTTSGSVDWQVNDDEPITVAAGQRLTFVNDSRGLPTDVEDFPAWIDGSDAQPRDPEAVRRLLPQVTVDRPISLSLKEQADSKRLEVRSLAVCSLAFLNDFDPVLVAMNDNRMKAYWTDEYRALTQAMVVSPEAAKLVRQALQFKHGPEGDDLFRLLWGFDSNQLQDGGAQKLVSYLDHPSSDFRIVAHENLKAITGTPSLYMPHYGEKLRKPHVFKWKDKLNKGQIVYREPPLISVLLDGETTDE